MRMATRVARRMAALPRASAPPSDPTETVAVNSVSAYASAVVGATDNNTGAATALSDSSDSTYVREDFYVFATVGFADLAAAGGRDVASFTLTIRCSADDSFTGVGVTAFGGITTTPSEDVDALPVSAGDIVLGPFTKSGGGNWTETQFNSMTVTVYGDGSNANLYRVRAIATYA